MSLTTRQIRIKLHVVEVPLAICKISHRSLCIYLCARREHISSNARNISLACETAKSHALHEVPQMQSVGLQISFVSHCLCVEVCLSANRALALGSTEINVIHLTSYLRICHSMNGWDVYHFRRTLIEHGLHEIEVICLGIKMYIGYEFVDIHELLRISVGLHKKCSRKLCVCALDIHTIHIAISRKFNGKRFPRPLIHERFRHIAHAHSEQYILTSERGICIYIHLSRIDRIHHVKVNNRICLQR